ncbi:MAG: hypothetical protein AABW41_00135 [Nanoarchaeota archaeon]
MTYIHTTQLINDPADIIQVSRPFLTDIKFTNRGRYKAKVLEEMFEKAQEKTRDKRHYGNFEKFFLYNSDLKEILPELKECFETVIFSTSVSINLTNQGSGIPKKIATDPFTESFALTSKMLQKYLENPEAYRNVLVVPVSPVVFPFTFKDGKIVHASKEIVYGVNDWLLDHNKKGFGSLEKSLESSGSTANYEFYEECFSSERRLYQLKKSPQEFNPGENIAAIKERIGYEVLLNNLIMINAFSNIIKLLGLTEINLFSMKTGYALPIIGRASTENKIPCHIIGGMEGPMRNTERSDKGESDISAINILNGFLVSRHAHKNKTIITPKTLPIKEEQGINLESLICPFNSYMLCPFQKKANTLEDCCNNNFFSEKEAKSVELLKKQAADMHFGIKGIETILVELMSGKDFDVVDSSRRHYSWRNEIKGKQIVLTPRFEVPSQLDIRSSSFYNDSVIGRFIGMYKYLFPITVKPNEFAEFGTLMHKIMFSQPDINYKHNELLQLIGFPVTNRQEYCERPVLYTNDGINVLGHFDASFLLQNGSEADIVVLDAKRSRKFPYAKLGYKYQLLSYALGIKNGLSLNPDNYYLILINRPFEIDLEKNPSILKGLHKSQEYTIIKVPNNDPFIERLNSRIEEVYLEDQRLLNDRKFFFSRLKEEWPFFQRFGDSREYCEHLISELKHHKNLRSYLKSRNESVGKL